MSTPTYDLLDSVTLGTSAASVTFSGISGSYGDLVLVINGTSTAAAGFFVQFNSDTGSNYSTVRMRGDGSSATSDSSTTTRARISSGDSTNETLIVTQIMDYSATDKHTTVLSRSSVNETAAHASRWADTSAVTTIDVFAFGTTVASGTTLFLYGVAK